MFRCNPYQTHVIHTNTQLLLQITRDIKYFRLFRSDRQSSNWYLYSSCAEIRESCELVSEIKMNHC